MAILLQVGFEIIALYIAVVLGCILLEILQKSFKNKIEAKEYIKGNRFKVLKLYFTMNLVTFIGAIVETCIL
ncbi:MAG: hypothetical protein ACK5NF_00850 [Bacilli bacterium]